MDNDHLRRLFPDGVYDEFIQILVDSLIKAYDTAGEVHGRDAGFDALTFGVMVWRLSWYHAEESLSAAGFRVDRPNNSLRVEVGPFSVHLYRAGDNANFDIENDFGFLIGTPTKTSIPTANSQQLTLFNLEGNRIPPPGTHCTQLVVAHTGNPTEGLCAAWLGAPVLMEDRAKWAWVTQIFTTAPPELAFLPPPPPMPQEEAGFVSFQEQPEPVVDLRLEESDLPGTAQS